MAALVAVGLSTATPGAPAKLSTALAVRGVASTLPLAHLALDPTGSAGSRAPVHLPGGGHPCTLRAMGPP